MIYKNNENNEIENAWTKENSNQPLSEQLPP